MKQSLYPLAIACLLTACPMPPAPAPPPPRVDVPGRTFDSVVTVLNRRYYDTTFVASTLKSLVEEFRPAATAAASPGEEREVIWRFLGRIPASHLALLSRTAAYDLWWNIPGETHAMMGMQLVQLDGRYFASMVLAGGPAARAGIHDWDEVVALDSLSPAKSFRVDWRSDDAYLTDDRDPPEYGIMPLYGDVRLQVVRVPGETVFVRVTPQRYSVLDAARASARIVTRDGVRVGYIHWWYMNSKGIEKGFSAALRGPLDSSQALVLDLRGRGGSETGIRNVLKLLAPGPHQQFVGPIVALTDRQTRSAKEMLAYQLRALGLARLVGEPTAGAVLGAGFEEISGSAILMYPGVTIPTYTAIIEGHPVEPDVATGWGGPYSGGRDPILEAGFDEAARLVHTNGAGFTRHR
ncbi:MAG TPA: S41 family peptidase [Gemmatimonadales bacterium]|nr:S41 family peptidase [Gemmatimonadales bacterium]